MVQPRGKMDARRESPFAKFTAHAHTLSDTKLYNGSFNSVLLNASSSLSDFSQGSISVNPQLGTSHQRARPPPLSHHHRHQSRSQCRKCVECTGLTDYRAVDQAKLLWPGNCSSALTYFTMSRRRLEHQIASVPRTSRIWVQGPQQLTQLSRGSGPVCARLAVRRGVDALDDLLIPITKTNVAYKASNVTLIGMKTLSVSRVSSPVHAGRKDSKRRCMSWRREEEQEEIGDSSSFKVAGSSQALQPSPFTSMQSMTPSLPSAQSEPTGGNLVVLDSRLAAASDVKLNKQDSAIPMLLSRESSGMTSMSLDDPTMQEYMQHQYAIKKEQAFACHAIDIADVAKVEAKSSSSTSKKFFGFGFLSGWSKMPQVDRR